VRVVEREHTLQEVLRHVMHACAASGNAHIQL
jgi:hypothetical protein